MLQYLSIHNYILIQDIHVTLSDKFNVFTGETGAGKSMLVDALNFVTGQRSSSNIVGRFSDSARVEAAFYLPHTHRIFAQLESFGFEVDPDDSLIVISREMSRDGRNVCRINHRVVNVSTIRDLFNRVVDIHSQHETQYLRDWKQHITLLDAYSDTEKELNLYQKAYGIYKDEKKKYDDFKSSEINPIAVEKAKEDLEAIDAIKPSLADYEMIVESLKDMDSFESKSVLLKNIDALFNESPSVVDRLYSGIQLFESLDDEQLLKQFKDAYYELDDIKESIQDKKETLNFDPYEYDRLQGRLHSYQQLIRKYGTLEDTLQKREALEVLIDQSLHYDDYLTDHKNNVEAAYANVLLMADKLTDKRKKGASRLEKAIVTELRELLLEHAVFVVSINEKGASSDGMNTIQFNVSMNKSEEPQPLDKVASGGELSRLMLGLKVIFSKIYGISTIIFDEIDTGVSGRVGFQIGVKMKVLSKSAQVITISHLSSVAACADHHYLISKAQDDLQTVTNISPIEGEARVEQLALLMSGALTDVSKEAASELLKEGQLI